MLTPCSIVYPLVTTSTSYFLFWNEKKFWNKDIVLFYNEACKGVVEMVKFGFVDCFHHELDLSFVIVLLIDVLTHYLLLHFTRGTFGEQS